MFELKELTPMRKGHTRHFDVRFHNDGPVTVGEFIDSVEKVRPDDDGRIDVYSDEFDTVKYLGMFYGADAKLFKLDKWVIISESIRRMVIKTIRAFTNHGNVDYLIYVEGA